MADLLAIKCACLHASSVMGSVSESSPGEFCTYRAHEANVSTVDEPAGEGSGGGGVSHPRGKASGGAMCHTWQLGRRRVAVVARPGVDE